MANTPNLDLVKPAGTDHALVSVINSNSDKIDRGFGTLSEQIGTKVGYNITDVYTGNVLEASAGLYRCPSTASNLPIASNGYLTVITRSTTLTFLQYAADNGRMFVNTRNSSSWTGWQELVAGFTPRTGYTPDITSDSEGFAVDNKSFIYTRSGSILQISGRFNITSVGSSPNKTLSISLPSGMSCADNVGACGSIFLNKTGVDISMLSVRQGANRIWIQNGAGDSTVLNKLGTGYIMLTATVILS